MVPASMIPKPVEEEPKEEADYSEGVFVKFNFTRNHYAGTSGELGFCTF